MDRFANFFRYPLLLPLLTVTFGCLAQTPNPAAVPTDRLGEGWWKTRHEALLETVKNRPGSQLLLIGDSITNNYDKAKLPDENFQPTWEQFYEPRQALNLGFSGDTTANVLWRLHHGEVAGLHPKVAILLIGTNNTGHARQTAEQTQLGIDAVIVDLEQRLPTTRILLLGILPSGISQEKTLQDRQINSYLANCYGENPRVTYVDIESIFYQRGGALDAALFYDPRLPQHGSPLHPDTIGQRRMAEAIEPTLAKLMDDEPRVPLTAMTDINTALIPVTRLEQDSYDWFARHHAELELQKTLKPRVVLIGDSITHFWDGPPMSNRVNGSTAWRSIFENLPVLNLGFGWDRTQNVLWRLRHGEVDSTSPEWIVIAIGTNNLAVTEHARANSPEEIVDGILAIRQEVRGRLPLSRIIVMGVFPRGADPNGKFRKPILKINLLLGQRLPKDDATTYLDIGQQFLTPDGVLPAAIMPDGTHPSDAGYQIWADALKKTGVRP